MKTLYLVVSLLLYIESVVTQAPGDGSPICLPGGALDFIRFPIPENIKVLMDSRDYELLLGNQGETRTWQQVNVDGIIGLNTIVSGIIIHGTFLSINKTSTSLHLFSPGQDIEMSSDCTNPITICNNSCNL